MTTAISLCLILLAVAFSSCFAYIVLVQWQGESRVDPSLVFAPEAHNSSLKAALVDQLSLTAPNQTFIETASAILKNAGYTVDYYSGEQVTVEFYRNLATHRYNVVILRVHSFGVQSFVTGAVETVRPAAFFTSELYSTTKYIYEQLTDQLVEVAYSRKEGAQTYFGICPLFVSNSMKDRFQSAIIITMGCESLDNHLMAKAFVEKGAKVYVGWTQPVSASHTDYATTQLLHHLFIEKLTLAQAFRETLNEVGVDPTFQSLLTFYPIEVGEQTIGSISGDN